MLIPMVTRFALLNLQRSNVTGVGLLWLTSKSMKKAQSTDFVRSEDCAFIRF